ncbi:MAG: hypothetical protein P1V97_32910 [Planctomycetota bacterium]|nr:hypothetical protein [Planctomycetota bacterium]
MAFSLPEVNSAVSDTVNLLDELKLLVQVVVDKWRLDPFISTTEIDPDLFEILEWIRKNIEIKALIIEYLLTELDKQDGFPQDIIEYCMVDLKWPEIHDAVKERLGKAEDPRVEDVLRDIESVYLGTWDYLDMFPLLEGEQSGK